jgi:hypothetical protein
VPDAIVRLLAAGVPVPHFESLASKTRLHGAESQVDPIGDLRPVCGSLSDPVGDLGEIVAYCAIEPSRSTSHSRAAGLGQLIADRVGEMFDRRELKHARIRLETESCDARSLRPQVQRFSSRAPRHRGEMPPPRSAAAAPPRLSRLTQAFNAWRHRRERRHETKFAHRPRGQAAQRREPV